MCIPACTGQGRLSVRGVAEPFPGPEADTPQPDTAGHGQAAGTHPTGMHSRNSFCIRDRFRKSNTTNQLIMCTSRKHMKVLDK